MPNDSLAAWGSKPWLRSGADEIARKLEDTMFDEDEGLRTQARTYEATLSVFDVIDAAILAGLLPPRHDSTSQEIEARREERRQRMWRMG